MMPLLLELRRLEFGGQGDGRGERRTTHPFFVFRFPGKASLRQRERAREVREAVCVLVGRGRVEGRSSRGRGIEVRARRRAMADDGRRGGPEAQAAPNRDFWPLSLSSLALIEPALALLGRVQAMLRAFRHKRTEGCPWTSAQDTRQEAHDRAWNPSIPNPTSLPRLSRRLIKYYRR